MNKSDGWVRLVTIQSYDVVVFQHSQSLSEFFLVQLGVSLQSVNLIFFSFILDEIEQISVLQSLRRHFGFVFSLEVHDEFFDGVEPLSRGLGDTGGDDIHINLTSIWVCGGLLHSMFN